MVPVATVIVSTNGPAALTLTPLVIAIAGAGMISRGLTTATVAVASLTIVAGLPVMSGLPNL